MMPLAAGEGAREPCEACEDDKLVDSVNDGLGLVERDRDFLLILSLRVPKKDRLGEEGDVMVDDGRGMVVWWCGGVVV